MKFVHEISVLKCRFLLLFLLSPLLVFSQNALNSKKLSVEDSVHSYHFFISAHFHGSSTNTTGLPAKTVLSNIEAINRDQPLFLAHLGDFFLDVRNDIPAYTENLLNRFEFPVYNAVGNHDLSGNVYQENFGATWFAFNVGIDRFIFLDTEIADGSIRDEQQSFLLRSLDSLPEKARVFIFAHRLIWAEDHPDLKNLFTDNTRSANPGNFRVAILPELKKIAEHHPVVFAGGSMGNVPSSFFFHKEKEADITYIATAIRDTPRDALLRVEVSGSGIHYTAFHLPLSPEAYDLSYYRPEQKTKSPFNWRLVPLYTTQAVSHRYFWYGVLFMVVPIALVVGMMMRRKKRKNGK
ncbi:MAG TPA: hypothetical protein PK637_04580 [Flavobacteriales bacterium]|nr:hypothetical protein [Flavobacteriales bacterium]HRE96018.1 hypothetical protein [Flavobacteriales bacterium]HRJ39589.1 hypothetical protein [Flavobacteriales bacterium]